MDAPYPPADGPLAPAVVGAAGEAGQGAGAAAPLPGAGLDGWAEGLRIRQARAADVAAIAAIERASFSDPWSPRSFRSALERPDVHMTVAEWRGEGGSGVAGYLVAWFVGNEGEIANVAVHPDWRRRGVGAALLDDVLASGRAAGVDTLYLEVRASNDAGQALYAGRGFRAVGRRRRYYTNPVEDALVLRWDSGAPSDAGA